MSSPFPGMDPYLEGPADWSDFHARFINYWCEAVSGLLPDGYAARIGERVYLVEGPVSNGTPETSEVETRRLIAPDVAVTRTTSAALGVEAAPSAVATLEPVTIPLLILGEVRETYIEILYRPDRSLVAVLELLSPANKEEPGCGAYLAKRNGLLHQDVHLVELDLLLKGHRLPLRNPLPPGDYYALVSRADRRPDCDVYAWALPRPLPPLPVPLRAPDPDVRVDLQAVFATAYERGRYAREVDYSAPPPVSVSKDALAWVEGRVRAWRP